jgi:hypothetical protein
MNFSDTRLYVIGDIHGRLDLLERMIDLVNLDIGSYGPHSLIVTLGDYIDRGPDSRGVVDRLLNNPFAGQFVRLKGNHEALFEKFVDDSSIGTDWWRLGGLETLKSFGITVGPRMTKRGFKKAAVQLRETLSQQQLEFFSSLQTSLAVGRYFLPASDQESLWSFRVRKTCYGSATSFSIAKSILERLSFTATLRLESRRCMQTESISTQALMTRGA